MNWLVGALACVGTAIALVWALSGALAYDEASLDELLEPAD